VKEVPAKLYPLAAGSRPKRQAGEVLATTNSTTRREEMEELNPKERLLVAIGAAIGSNCVPCMEKLVPTSLEAGIEKKQILAAIQLADMVRRKPARKVLERSSELIGMVTRAGSSEGDGAVACPLEGATQAS
jgi:4-carboxymuconolactone decarboxylase